MTGIHIMANTILSDNMAPVIPEKLPVAGSRRSFHANSLQLPVGAKIAAWKDDAGSGTYMTPGGAAAGASAPTLAETGGVLAAAFNGNNQQLGQDLALNQPYTLMMVFRFYTIKPATNNIILSGGPVLFADSNPNWRWNVGGGSIASISGADTAWHVLIATGDGASSIFNIDGTEVSASGTAAFSKLVLGASFNGFIERVEILNRALGFTERAIMMEWLTARKP